MIDMAMIWTLILEQGDTTGDPTDWCGSYTNAGWTKLDFYLRNENNKYSRR